MTDLKVLVHKALENEDLESYDLKFCGGTEKGEGYIGEIAFVDLYGKKKDGTDEVYALVLKTGGKNRVLRSIVRLGFEREIQIYSKVIPAFWNLQDEYLMQKFQSIPRCYLTVLSNDEEALVLQNLKSLDFKLFDRKQVMPLKHIKLVLKVLGQWHALSFALKKKRPDEFKALTCNWTCPATEIFVNSHVGDWVNMAQKHLMQALQETGDLDLLQKYQEKTENRLATCILKDILTTEEEQAVVTHGDCWNNNLMFKYEAANPFPSDVALLDFQISNVSSPALDLSYFIYAVASEEELRYFDDMLRTYYRSFSGYLLQMDCNPEELFSYPDLKQHWRKYSAYGALINPLIVCDNLVDKDDAVSYAKKDLEYDLILQSVDQKQKEAFSSRLLAVARHFVTYCD